MTGRREKLAPDTVSGVATPLQPASSDGRLAAEVQRLRRQLRREQLRREAAESIGERATTDLYYIVRRLREAQSELVERASQDRLVSELGRALRQELQPQRVVSRAAELIGRTLQVDLCEVVLSTTDAVPGGYGFWPAEAAPAALAERGVETRPDALRVLLVEAAERAEPLWFDHLSADVRLGDEAMQVAVEQDVEALAAIPIHVGTEVIGWIMLESRTPRAWQPREMVICETLARDLAVSLVQAQAFERQRQSVRRLQELDRSKDIFISTVSHELRTPLTSIVGYLEMMADGGMGELTPELAHGIEIVERNAVRLRAVVEDLLTLSAYDAAALTLQQGPVDLAAIVVECESSLLPVATTRGVHLEVAIQDGCAQPLGDEEQLHRAVLNLVNNAVKFTASGGRVEVLLRQEDGEVVLQVTDDGMGIPADELPRIFERFFRSTLSVRDELQGTGLGLALAKTVIDAHGGRLELDSVESVGTTATVRLPLPV